MKPRMIRKVFTEILRLSEAQPDSQQFMKILVIGLPNVGKSTILNGLRRIGMNKGKAARTGSVAGITRKMAGMVRLNETPPIYILDSPGVMVTGGLVSDEAKLKIVLTGGTKDDLDNNGGALCDYLFKRLEEKGLLAPFCREMDLNTEKIEEIIPALSRRLGFLLPGNVEDHHRTMAWILLKYRQGRLGKFILDT